MPAPTITVDRDPYVSEQFAGSLVMMPDAPPRPRPRSSEFFMPYEAIPPQSADSSAQAPLAPDQDAVQAEAIESVTAKNVGILSQNNVFIRFEEEDSPGGLKEGAAKNPGKKSVTRETEAPRFHNPKAVRFFDPVAAAAEREGGSLDEVATGPRPSIELSPELKAAIIQMDEKLRQRKEQQQKAPPSRPKKKWWQPITKRPLQEGSAERKAATPIKEPIRLEPAVEEASLELPFQATAAAMPVPTETAQTSEPRAISHSSAGLETVAFVEERAVPLREQSTAAAAIDLAVGAEMAEESSVKGPDMLDADSEAIASARASQLVVVQAVFEPLAEEIAAGGSAVAGAAAPLKETDADVEKPAEIDIVRPWLTEWPATEIEPIPGSASPAVEPAAKQEKASGPRLISRVVRRKPYWSRVAPAPQAEAPAPAAEAKAVTVEAAALTGTADRSDTESAKPVVESVPAATRAAEPPAAATKVRAPASKTAAKTAPMSATQALNLEAAREQLKAQTAPVVEVQPVRKKRVWPSVAPAKAQKDLAEVAPEVVEQKAQAPKKSQGKEKSAKEKLSLGARLQRWLESDDPGLLSHLDGKRNGKRKSVPGLVAFYFSGGAPAPHEVLNISKTGLYMRTQEVWSQNTMVRMTLQRPDIEKSISVLTRVVRIDDGGVGHEFITSAVLNGLRIRDVMPEHGTNQRELEEFLAITARKE